MIKLPSQDHCSCLVNIIHIHVEKIAQKIPRDHETVFLQLKQEISDLKHAHEQMKVRPDEYQNEINKLKWSMDGIRPCQEEQGG